MGNVWTVKRLTDTLEKYPNHEITGFYNYSNYIEISLLYKSAKKHSRTVTTIKIYCDDYDLEHESK